MIDRLVINSVDTAPSGIEWSYDMVQRKIYTKIVYLCNLYHVNNEDRPSNLYASPRLIAILSDMVQFVPAGYPNPNNIGTVYGYIFDMGVYNSNCDDNRIIISPNKDVVRDSKINVILEIEEKDYEYILEIESDLIF
jgi:hypothetical protein